MYGNKIMICEKRGGETKFKVKSGDVVYTKGTNIRRSKDKLRYEKALVVGEIERNIVPVTLKNRTSKIPIKDVKRPPQMHRASLAGHSHSHQDPCSSTSAP